ncbi:hypothetical protein [Paraburkholderia bengalensis]
MTDTQLLTCEPLPVVHRLAPKAMPPLSSNRPDQICHPVRRW